MTGETVPLREHLAALRDADLRFNEERDRRYAEVNIEREKALKIKETADLAALGLAREIQNYKDEKANELREQINSERGLYATNKDIDPIKSYVASQTGRGLGMYALFGVVMTLVTVALAIAVYLK
jgi:hypothetical protein